MQLCFFRDAWSEVKGVSKEEARKNYVQKLLEVRVTSPSLSTLTKPLTAIDPEGGRYRRIEEVHHRNWVCRLESENVRRIPLLFVNELADVCSMNRFVLPIGIDTHKSGRRTVGEPSTGRSQAGSWFKPKKTLVMSGSYVGLFWAQERKPSKTMSHVLTKRNNYICAAGVRGPAEPSWPKFCQAISKSEDSRTTRHVCASDLVILKCQHRVEEKLRSKNSALCREKPPQISVATGYTQS